MNTEIQASILIKRNLDLSATSALNVLSQKGRFPLGFRDSLLSQGSSSGSSPTHAATDGHHNYLPSPFKGSLETHSSAILITPFILITQHHLSADNCLYFSLNFHLSAEDL